MNIRIGRKQTNQGSALAVTLMTCLILGLLMGSYLYMVQGQRQSVARSQSWNKAIVVAEAGVDEALALMNTGIVGTNFAVNPWKHAGGGIYTNRPSPLQYDENSSYYVASIDASIGTNPVITSIGYVLAPISKTTLARTLRVQTAPKPTFPVRAPMVVKETYDASGMNVNTDSFDSSAGPYGSGAIGANGDVVTLKTNANSIKVGNGKINGTVRTPPGGIQGVTATIGSGGKVGDSAFIADSTTSGFQAGHFKDDFTLTDFPDVSMPSPIGNPVAGGGIGPDTLKYDYLLGSAGTYTMADLNGSLYVGFPDTVLYVTDNISISGNSGSATTYNSNGTIKKNGTAGSQIHIAAGASLKIYMSGVSTTISGNGIVNDTAAAKDFQYYGLPSNTALNITGNAAFYGTIYAPQAALTLKGSGNNSTDDFTGASVTKTTTMTGNFNFHYDTSLSLLTTLGGYDATSWEEL